VEIEEAEDTITIEVVDMQIKIDLATIIKKETVAEVDINNVAMVETIEATEAIVEIAEEDIKIIVTSTIKTKIVKLMIATINNSTPTLRNSTKKTKETSKFSKEIAEAVVAIKNMIIIAETEVMSNNSNTIPDQGEAMEINIKTIIIKMLTEVSTHSTETLNNLIMNTRVVISRKIKTSSPIIVITIRIIRNKFDILVLKIKKLNKLKISQ
jgi:hypothetical protein